ncbi:hypothetical protein [Homoserinibacter sp. GY 40078]|uniref:hypothetical protein n=1 Tax=Homoserinibacter sp. GY 40078 TaxID=2603275 RepID=UPI0011C91620|nr:hypothetical protein [Homoserinibacter sp. GY 40078]TXK19595.1 hypothetical protein FVQ89_06905 [Homoserinibacter sp. GY 40078]
MVHRTRILAAVAAAVLAGTTLAGCSLLPDPVRDIVDQVQESGVPNPLGSIPDDFPDEVPLVDGDVLVGLKPTDDSWTVTIQVADEAAATESTTLLEDAGFTQQFEGTGAYTDGTWLVIVQWSPIDDGGYGVAYVVTPA